MTQPDREFTHEGRTWIARVSGRGAYGTGDRGLAVVEAIHFLDAAAPDRVLREVLVPHGDFAALFDSELIRMLAMSVPIEERNG